MSPHFLRPVPVHPGPLLLAAVAVLLLGVLPIPSGLVASGSVAPPAPLHPQLSAAGATADPVRAAMASLQGPVTQNATTSPAWINVSAGAHPPYRGYGRSFAYDPVDQYVVLFGGDGATGYLADTWTFHSGTWTQLSPKTSPSARDHATLAWDPVAQYLVLFGGSGNTGASSDTWTFVHGNWSQLSEATHPSARWASTLTWDAADQEMVLFGGCAGSAVGDTWTFANGSWTQLHPSPAPEARENAVLEYDPAIAAVVLFGGDDYYAAYDADTWTFAGGNWTEQQPASSPSARAEAAAAYDPSLNGVVVFGGTGVTATYGDTWYYANGNWWPLTLTVAPPPRAFGLMADDPLDGELILFGGSGYGLLTDTWALYNGTIWSSASISSGVAPLSVDFQANSSGLQAPVAYRWSFGDGNTSSAPSVRYLFTQPGHYQVELRVSDAGGSSATVDFQEQVGWALNVSATAGPLIGLAPLLLQGAVAAQGGTPPYTYLWQSGTGATSDLASPTFSYATPGLFLASVLVEDSGGAHFYRSFNVSVGAPPPPPALTASIVPSQTRGPAPLSTVLVSQVSGGVAPYRLTWSLGDGSTVTGLTVVSASYAAPGRYVVELQVVDSVGKEVNATVGITATPSLWVTAVPPSPTQLPAAVTFTGSVGGGVAPYLVVWDFGDNSGGTLLNTSHVYPGAGNYTATLRVSDALGSQALVQVSVSVTPAAAPTDHTPPSTSTPASSGSLPTIDLVAGSLVLGVVVGGVGIAVLRGRRSRE